MGRKISNRTRSAKKRKPFTWQSPETRARAMAAGAANLARYRAECAQRPALKHGVASFINSGNLPAEIERRLSEFQAGLLSDLGGEATTAQKTLIESTKICLGVCLLVSVKLSAGGVSKLQGNRWVLGTLGSYLNTLRLNLQALGLERRAKQADLTIEAVVAEYAKRPEQP